MLDLALKEVAVIGAGGKMGRGIALLLLQEMARTEAEKTGAIGKGGYHLHLIDSQSQALDSLIPYLKSQLIRFCEKHIGMLRTYFAKNKNLIDNGEIIEAFVAGALTYIRLDTDAAKAKGSSLIFEAIVEDIETKKKVYAEIHSNNANKPYYFSNTSSIPIEKLNSAGQLDNRIIGFHFYNPPPVQKLVELIVPKGIDPALPPLAKELGQRLHKTIIPSNDVAGFVGNGHFIRDIQFACQQVKALAKEHSQVEAIYLINKVSHDFMLRPMGIFQLIDYVGLDVCRSIASIMSTHIPGQNFSDSLIDEMLQAGIKGGQHPDGSQKDGFFKHEGNQSVAVYSLKDKKYEPIGNTPWAAACDAKLGKFAEGHLPWKKLSGDPSKEDKLKAYFGQLFQEKSFGAELAKKYLLSSKEIAKNLVKDGIAHTEEDVNAVLQHGFHHLYGPINSFY